MESGAAAAQWALEAGLQPGSGRGVGVAGDLSERPRNRPHGRFGPAKRGWAAVGKYGIPVAPGRPDPRAGRRRESVRIRRFPDAVWSRWWWPNPESRG